MKSLRFLVLIGLLSGCADLEDFILGPEEYPVREPVPYDPAWRSASPQGPQVGPPAVGAPATPRNQASFQPTGQTREPDLAR